MLSKCNKVLSHITNLLTFYELFQSSDHSMCCHKHHLRTQRVQILRNLTYEIRNANRYSLNLKEI